MRTLEDNLREMNKKPEWLTNWSVVNRFVDKKPRWYCSMCYEIRTIRTPICPICKAQMQGELDV